MRTTLTIEDDVLLAAKQLARAERVSVGQALSKLARLGLNRRDEGSRRNGVQLLPVAKDAQVVTLELVNELRDELM